MKRRNKHLKYFAFREDFKTNKLERFNIFYKGFADEILKRIKQDKIDSYDKLKSLIEVILKNHYFSKPEHEVIVTSLYYGLGHSNDFKIDVWYQLEPNLDLITKYIINELNIEF